MQNDNINQLRANLTEMIENLNSEIKDTRKVIQNNFESNEKASLVLGEKIKSVNMSIENIEAALHNNREMHREKAIKL